MAKPHTDLNGGSGDMTAREEEEELNVDQDQGTVADRDAKVEDGKPDKLLGAALAAESTMTREEASEDVEVELLNNDNLDGSQTG